MKLCFWYLASTPILLIYHRSSTLSRVEGTGLTLDTQVGEPQLKSHLKCGKKVVFFTPHRLRLQKRLLRIRSSSENHRNMQVRLRLNSAKFQILQ